MKKGQLTVSGFLVFLLVFFVRLSAGQDLFDSQPSRKQALRKLESNLYEIALSYRTVGIAEATNYAARTALSLTDEKVEVIIESKDDDIPIVEPLLRDLGGKIETTYEGLIQALLPLRALEDIALISNIKFVRRPFIPIPAVTSEGVAKIGADVWQAAGYRGNAVKVAIVDLGFQGYSSRLGTELPSSIIAKSFRADGDGVVARIATGPEVW